MITTVMPPNVDLLVQSTRSLLRDFPQFFEVDLGPLNVATIRLPHPLVDVRTLQVYVAPQVGALADSNEQVAITQVPDTDWTLDARNGLLKFNSTGHAGKRVFVSGYHYEWFLDEDLVNHVVVITDEHLMGRYAVSDLSKDQISPIELDLIAIGAVVRAVWTLLTEFSTDIDISSPEGIFIPARQRFQQLWQMLQHWESIYSERTKQLNVGLGNIDIFTLRRQSYMTNRYVPVYKGREYDDHNPPVRVRPLIPDGTTTPPVPGDTAHAVEVSDLEEIGREAQDLGFGGWQSIGSRGD